MNFGIGSIDSTKQRCPVNWHSTLKDIQENSSLLLRILAIDGPKISQKLAFLGY